MAKSLNKNLIIKLQKGEIKSISNGVKIYFLGGGHIYYNNDQHYPTVSFKFKKGKNKENISLKDSELRNWKNEQETFGIKWNLKEVDPSLNPSWVVLEIHPIQK